MPKRILIAILLVASLLRLWGLSRGDPVNDEVFYAFRGLGMLDFDEAQAQTTPLEWFDPEIPSWTKLSFHDHPPLVFLVEHFSLKLFGENNIGMRLPSALLGIASVWLLYQIATRTYSRRVGSLAAALLAVSLNHVYISRLGLQESYVIFFLLLASYLFLKSLTHDSYLIPTGAAIGLGLLAKYTSVVAIPIVLTYLLFFRRAYFRNKKFWIGVALALVIFSPVLVYNLKLYQRVRHFDFQLSYIAGQNPDVWRVAPGKDIGTLGHRIRIFVPRLIASYSWVFLGLFTATLIGFLYSLRKNPASRLRQHAFLLITLLYLFLMLLAVGPSYRFLALLAPFLAEGIALGLQTLYSRWPFPRAGTGTLAVLLVFEILYSINNEIAYYPTGPTPWLASPVRYENYNWGYNELGDFLKNELDRKIPAVTFDLRYKFLEDLKERVLEQGVADGKEAYPALLVTYGNFDPAAKLWIVDRYHIYHAWPIIHWETYQQYLRERGTDFYAKSGFRTLYLIATTNTVPTPDVQSLVRHTRPIPIRNHRGDEAFRVYKIPLGG